LRKSTKKTGEKIERREGDTIIDVQKPSEGRVTAYTADRNNAGGNLDRKPGGRKKGRAVSRWSFPTSRQ